VSAVPQANEQPAVGAGGDVPRLEKLLWGLDEAAHALGVSPRTLKRMDAANELPEGVVVHLGRRRLFSRKALEQWVARGCPRIRRAGR
jgi:excisionase family DNA binding protein